MEKRPSHRAARTFRQLVVAAVLCLCNNVTCADLDLEAQCALSKSMDVLQRYLACARQEGH